MTEFIQHRVNQIAALRSLRPGLGVEIDIRSSGGTLILNHEPFATGDDLEEYLDVFAASSKERLLILNTKEDGLEPRILEALERRGIERFFFLDSALPTLVRLVTVRKEKRAAVRVSEYEPVESAERFAGLAQWAWVDCFAGVPPSLEAVRRLRRAFKVCLVSPELQPYPAERIADFKFLRDEVDAVCTKNPSLWS